MEHSVFRDCGIQTLNKKMTWAWLRLDADSHRCHRDLQSARLETGHGSAMCSWPWCFVILNWVLCCTTVPLLFAVVAAIEKNGKSILVKRNIFSKDGRKIYRSAEFVLGSPIVPSWGESDSPSAVTVAAVPLGTQFFNAHIGRWLETHIKLGWLGLGPTKSFWHLSALRSTCKFST